MVRDMQPTSCLHALLCTACFQCHADRHATMETVRGQEGSLTVVTGGVLRRYAQEGS